MVSPFHKVKNAESAMQSVDDHPATTEVETTEQLGNALIEFQFADDASLQSAFAMRDLLHRSGFKEQTEDSELDDTLRYEWDKKYLMENK